MYRFDGHHSGGSSFVYVYDILIRLLKKKKEESQYMVSRLGTRFGSANRVRPGIGA